MTKLQYNILCQRYEKAREECSLMDKENQRLNTKITKQDKLIRKQNKELIELGYLVSVLLEKERKGND